MCEEEELFIRTKRNTTNDVAQISALRLILTLTNLNQRTMKKTISPEKKVKRLVVLLILCTALLLPNITYAQTTCATSTALTPNTSCSLTDYQLAGSDTARWFSFVADSQRVFIDVEAPVLSTPTAHIHSLDLYGGSCGSPTLLAARDINNGDSTFSQNAILKIDYSGLTIGLTYYIRVARRTAAHCLQTTCTNTTAHFSICVKNTSLVWFCNWPYPYNCGENIGNGSFEYIEPTWNSGCPFDITQQGDPIVACPWDGMPLPAFVTSTPDFFNSCSNPSDVGVSLNGFGTQASHSGNGYAGISGRIQFPVPQGNGFEGLLQTLTTPLIAGKVYYEEMYVSLADISNWGTPIGFTSFPTGNPNDYFSPIITDKINWTQVSHCFTATGTEVNRAISWNGSNLSQTTPLTSDPGYTYSNPPYPTSYFYIDDVSLRPLAYAGPSITTCNFNTTIGCTALTPITGATYSWSVAGPSGATITSPSSQSTYVSFTTVGTYTFTITTTVTTLQGTCSATDVMTVTVNGFSSVINTTTSTICLPGSANLSVTNTPSTGTFTYLWTPSTGLSSTTINNPVATPTVTTTYTVVVTNTTTGCASTATITLTAAPAPVATITGLQTNNCGSGTLTYNAPCVSGVSYSWSVSGGSPATGTGCSINVNWLSTGGTITLTAILGSCTTVTSLAIPPCCDYVNPYKITNTTASAVLIDPAFAPIRTGSIIDGNLMGTPILINGVFTIDANITFEECLFLDFGVNCQIQILPGCTLTLDNSRNDQKCAYMWDGIYINGPTAVFKMKNASVLKQAKNTIVSIGGGVYGISNSSLIDDVKGIQVLPYAGPHTGKIVKSTIKMQGTFLPAFPALPTGTNKTLIGIEVSSVNTLTIGDATLAATTNVFDNLYMGIKATGSSLNIINNTFQNILPLTSPSPCCFTSCSNSFFCSPYAMAIYITGGVPSSNFSASIGGTGTYQPNTFLNCGSGIRTEGSLNLNITQNKFTISTAASSNGTGILIQNNNSVVLSAGWHTVVIQNNTFNAFKTAVSMRYATNTKTDIRNNTITSANQAVISYGIKVQDMNGTGNGGYTNIQGNTISGVWYGIVAIQVKNGFINKGSQPAGNTINLSNLSSTATTVNGISVHACSNTWVASNTITKVGPTIASAPTASTWIGIRMSNCPGVMIDRNTMINMGSGIYCQQVNLNNSLACNNFNSCYYGVTYNQAVLGNQFGSGMANQNRWNSNIAANRMSGTVANLNPVLWYYDLGFGSNTDPNPDGILLIAPVPLTGSYDICPFLPAAIAPSPSIANRQTMFQKIAYDSLQFTLDTVENRYACRLYAYRQFRDDSTWLNLGDPSDTIYQAFYNSIYNSDIETMAQVEDYIYTGDIVNGTSLNNSIITGTELIGNRQVVNDIYLNTVANGVFEYSPADSATLYAIAIKSALLGGDGVYRARVMLDMMVFDTNGVGMRTRPQNQATSYPAGRVYPNPNTGTMQLDYTLAEKETGELVMYDLSGKKIRTYYLSEGQNTLQINEEGLVDGVYMYAIFINGEMKLTDKVVIIK